MYSLVAPPAQILRQHFGRRSFLPTKESSLWRIESGLVRTLTWLEDGSIITLGLWGRGDVVGQGLSQVEPYQMECLSKVEVTALTNWQQDAVIWREHLHQHEGFLLIRSQKRVDTMLLHLLSWLAKKCGKEVSEGQMIDLRLTHQDIAEILGTTRVTITRTLNQFEHQGLITRHPLQRIVLKEEEAWHYQI
jgi:CRP-like cAMP-binding protein